MKRGKYSKSAARKPIALVLALVLVLGAAIGGTIAWLTDKTGPVTNTFTTSDIEISLVESPNLDLKMIPGHTITKDPKVTVDPTSEDCYLFVKIEKNESFDQYFEPYVVDSKWTPLDETKYPGVYYIDINTAEEKGTAIPVLADNQVEVLSNVTKDMMKKIDNQQTVAPKLTFTAYAIQRNSTNDTPFSAENAWQKITTP